MITPLQNFLKQHLAFQPSIDTRPQQSVFANRIVKRSDLVKRELSSFLAQSPGYATITDKDLIERMCSLCKTSPDEIFEIKEDKQRAKALLKAINSCVASDDANDILEQYTASENAIKMTNKSDYSSSINLPNNDIKLESTTQKSTNNNLHHNQNQNLEYKDHTDIRHKSDSESKSKPELESTTNTDASVKDEQLPWLDYGDKTDRDWIKNELKKWIAAGEPGEQRSTARERIHMMFLSEIYSPRITKLDLSGLGLKELPPVMLRLNFLSELNISNNKLTTLPSYWKNIDRLEKLDMSSNYFTEFPPQLTGLKSQVPIEISVESNNIIDINNSIISVLNNNYCNIKSSPPLQDNIREHQQNTENKRKYEERKRRESRSHIKLLSKQESQDLQQKVLDTYNLMLNTNYETLSDFFRSDESISWVAINNSNITELALAAMYFSEDFQGQDMKELANSLGIISEDISKSSWNTFCESLRHPTKIIKKQEDLDDIVSNLQYFSKDIEYKTKKLTGREDPDIKYLSIGEHSIHAPEESIKKSVRDKLTHLKTLALDESLSVNDTLYATIEYAMQKANAEIVHSRSRMSELLFENNPFLEIEGREVSIAVQNVYDTEKLNINNKESEDINEQEISKFGNCDHFSENVQKTFEHLNYELGGYGKILITSPTSKNLGHSLNYITLADKVMVVDAWKGIYFDLSNFRTFFPEYCESKNSYTLEFEEKYLCNLEIISSILTPCSMEESLEIINKEYTSMNKNE